MSETIESLSKQLDDKTVAYELLTDHYEELAHDLMAARDRIKELESEVARLRPVTKCPVCGGLGYSVGVSKRVPCKSCNGTGRATPDAGAVQS